MTVVDDDSDEITEYTVILQEIVIPLLKVKGVNTT